MSDLTPTSPVPAAERQILRTLAQKVRDLAALPTMAERKKLVEDLNSLRPSRPVISCLPEGAWTELLPDSTLTCRHPLARNFERQLRINIMQVEFVADDSFLEPFFNLNWVLDTGNYGVQTPREYGDNRGSFHWDPPIKDLERDFDKLKHRQPSVDRPETNRRLALAHDLFGDILPPRIRMWAWWSVGMTQDLVYLIGLQELMMAMVDQPDMVHQYMAFLRDDYAAYMSWFEREGLLTPNADVHACGSGGLARTRDLPTNDTTAHRAVKLKDMWGLAESQETVGVSPSMFAEFILPYQLPLMEKFGLTYYGCCEQLHHRIDHVLQAKNLRRVSVSPWADQEIMAEKLGPTRIFCRKPNPTLVCLTWDEDVIRRDLRATIAAAKRGGCPLEIILKDTHTVQNQPWRIQKWVQIAREEVDRAV